MINKRIVYTRPDGGVTVTIPSPRYEGTIEELAAQVVPVGIDYQIVDVATIPFDRYFREAWKEGVGIVDIDMPKAREVHMGNIRKVRDKELARLDIEQLKGNDVAALKQTLRDIPQSFGLTEATTPDELKALWPQELPKEGI